MLHCESLSTSPLGMSPSLCDLGDLLGDLENPESFLFEGCDPILGGDTGTGADDLFVDILTPPYSPVAAAVFREIAEATFVDQILGEHDYSKPPLTDLSYTTDFDPVPAPSNLAVPTFSSATSSSSDSTHDSSESDVDVVTVTSDPEIYDKEEVEPVKIKKPKRKYVRKDTLCINQNKKVLPSTGKRRGRKPASFIHSETSSPYESEQDKKETHNQLERKRRNDLSRAYQDVRVLIPSLQDNPRASKVKILESAASLVHSFTEQNFEESLRRERKEVERLIREISRIQSQQN